jgi:mono/diheme cytochrome c family protein
VNTINRFKTDPSRWLHPENGTLDGVVGFVNVANTGVAVPFSAADDARDHWLSPGEPHCADCHTPPYVEQSGNINGFAPFNYPRKAGLMRYSRGHRDITCQGCHESIHGLYPVAPDLQLGKDFPGVDATSYAQAANLNADGSHGPLKCGSCHAVNASGVPSWFRTTGALGTYVSDFDAAVGWQHEFTENADPRESMCLNCHTDLKADVTPTNLQWQRHAERGRAPRNVMDQTEELQNGHIAGFKETSPGIWEPDAETALSTVCTACHAENHAEDVTCDNTDEGNTWKQHLVLGRSNREVWAAVSESLAGSTCGW